MLLLKMKKEPLGYKIRFLGIIAFALMLASCDKSVDGGAAQQGMAAIPVGYVTMVAEDVGVVTELPGRLEAFRIAEVRPQVTGIVLRRLFEEGGDVKAGQSLFQIDDALYQAALQSAQAQLAQAQANYAQAKAQADRLKPLVAANAVSQQVYDDAYAAQKVAEASILAAKAAINTAQVNINYAKVISPIDGRIGRAYVTEGALVGGAVTTSMAIVQQIDPLYVNFTQSATDVMKLQQDIASGLYKAEGDGSIPVTVILENGVEYPEKGKLLFTDLTVDASTGRVSLRAELPNPQKLLLPNLYVRVRLEQATIPGAFLVPQQAVTRKPQGDSLLVITPDNIVVPRQVTVGGRSGQSWIVSSGLKDGDRVMVDGVIKWGQAMQMAMQKKAATGEDVPIVVQPTPWPAESEGAGAPAPAAETAPAVSGQTESAPSPEQTKP
ncbi:MAG: efflux RND transporter periplasmic adaptor subunit [Saezia sp.]